MIVYSENKQQFVDDVRGNVNIRRAGTIPGVLVPYEQRVDRALANILSSHPWKTPQREWLETIAGQIKANIIVDESNLNQGIFKQIGGTKRASKLFEQPIEDILSDFNKALWAS